MSMTKRDTEIDQTHRFTNFHTIGDVLRLAFNEENAGPYCSPGWTRNGSHIVALAIVEHFRGWHEPGEPAKNWTEEKSAVHDVDGLLKWLRTTEKWPGRKVNGETIFGKENEQATDQHYWDRARTKIADYVDDDRKEQAAKAKVNISDDVALRR